MTGIVAVIYGFILGLLTALVVACLAYLTVMGLTHRKRR